MAAKDLLAGMAGHAKRLAQATRETGEAAFSYGKQKVGDGIDGAKEMMRKRREGPRIVDEAKAKYQRAVARFELEREHGMAESSLLDTLEQEIIRHEFVRFGHIYEYAVQRTLQLRQETGRREFAFEVPAVELGGSIPASLKGIAAGGAAATAAVGMTALWGTASTGVAIAALNGSAAVSATLAALGGGSLAAGGFGIAGGLVVAGGAFVVPAVAVGTYFWGKDIERDYARAVKYRDEVEEAVRELEGMRKKFREAGLFARLLRHDLSHQRTALGMMLDIFERSLSTGHTKEAYEICGNAVALMGQSMTIAYQMESPTGNEASLAEQDRIAMEFGRLQQRFGAYVATMEESCRKDAEAYLAAQEEAMRNRQEQAPAVRPLKDGEIRRLLEDTFRFMAQQEICIIAPWVTSERMDALMEDALERGVTVKILYGIQGKGSSGDGKKRQARTRERISSLRQRFARFGDRFRTKEGNTHAKLLVADDRYYYIGSYNLLSFWGDYEQKPDLREEIGDYSENKRMVRFYKETYFGF